MNNMIRKVSLLSALTLALSVPTYAGKHTPEEWETYKKENAQALRQKATAYLKDNLKSLPAVHEENAFKEVGMKLLSGATTNSSEPYKSALETYQAEGDKAEAEWSNRKGKPWIKPYNLNVLDAATKYTNETLKAQYLEGKEGLIDNLLLKPKAWQEVRAHIDTGPHPKA